MLFRQNNFNYPFLCWLLLDQTGMVDTSVIDASLSSELIYANPLQQQQKQTGFIDIGSTVCLTTLDYKNRNVYDRHQPPAESSSVHQRSIGESESFRQTNQPASQRTNDRFNGCNNCLENSEWASERQIGHDEANWPEWSLLTSQTKISTACKTTCCCATAIFIHGQTDRQTNRWREWNAWHD